MKNPLSTHRISLEPRGGSSAIWLMFYETLHSGFYQGWYKQQLIRIFKEFESAEIIADGQRIRRKITVETIIRDDSHRHERLRQA